MQVCAKHWVYNNKPTVIIMCFFSTSVFCFCGHSAAKLQETQNKNKQRKKMLQKPLGHFSYRNIEHILKNYKYLQSLVSLRLLCGSGETSGALRVALSSFCLRENVRCVFVGLCSCASASGDMWRVRSAGASTVSSLENLNAAENKSSEVPDLNLYKKNVFKIINNSNKKKCSRHWTDCDFKQKNPHF